MTYRAPTVVVLGDATRIVQIVGKPNGTMTDPPFDDLHPAYDLDE